MASTTALNSGCNVGGVVVNRNPLFLRPSSSTLVKQSWRRSPKLRFTVRASETHADGPTKKLGLSDAECEAAVVAGNVPEAPPIPSKPAAPSGSPVVPSLVNNFLSLFFCNLNCCCHGTCFHLFLFFDKKKLY